LLVQDARFALYCASDSRITRLAQRSWFPKRGRYAR
jgi:hypothetical protein